MNNHILIVDDEAEIRQLLTVILERAVLKTANADSGAAALKSMEASIPDLIILDIMMEELGGFELLKLVRDRRLMVPVLLLSAKSEDSDKVHGFGLGADDL